MKPMLVFPLGTTKACLYAVSTLAASGVSIIDHPAPEVTHLLLDVPSFGADGNLRGGGAADKILEQLPPDIVVIGGNLSHPALAKHCVMDLLRDEMYLASNAAITADCALRIAAQKMTLIFAESSAVVIGWGRIGKCLGMLLKAVGCRVTIAARKESDRAMIRALGFTAVDIPELPVILPHTRLLFNTAPELILPKETLASGKNCIKIDLASKPGIEGEDVIWARGLPGIHAPESSGKRIAETILRLCREGSR